MRLLVATFILMPMLAFCQSMTTPGVGQLPQKFDTIAQLVSRPGTNYQTVLVRGYSSVGDWGPERQARFIPGTGASTNLGCDFAATNNVGRWNFPDCDSGEISAIWFGATPDDGTDDTTAIQSAIDVALEKNTGVFIPEGVFTLKPWGGTNVLVLGYSDYTRAVGATSATHPSTPYLESPQFTGIKIRGASSASKRSVWLEPYSIPNKGTVLQFTNLAAGNVGIWCGHWQTGVALEELTLIGDGFDKTTIGVRQPVGSSNLRMKHVTLQYWGTAIGIGDDVLSYGDEHADYNWLEDLLIYYCDTGIRWRANNAYVNQVINSAISARICLDNSWSDGSLRFSPRVQVTGGFMAPLTEWNSKLVSGVIDTVTGTNITITSATTFQKYRTNDVTHVLTTNIAAYATGDVTAGMIVLIASDCATNAYQTARPTDWSVPREVSLVVGDAFSLDSTPEASVAPGDSVVIGTLACAFYGDNFDVVGTHVEQARAEDFGYGGTVAWLKGWRNTTVFRELHHNGYWLDTPWNRRMPKIYHKGINVWYGYGLKLENCSFAASWPKLMVDDSRVVELSGNWWKNHPLILDLSGNYANNVILDRETYQFAMRADWTTISTQYAEPLPSPVVRSHTRESVGAPVPENRFLHALSSQGVSTEIAYWGAENSAYTPKDTTARGVYVSDAAYDIDSAITISAGSHYGTVTNLTGLFPGRLITITNAGAGGTTPLRARIVDIYMDSTGSTKAVWLNQPAEASVTSQSIAAVAADWRIASVVDPMTIGHTTNTVPPVTLLGGASGADVFKLSRTTGTTQSAGFRLGAGTLIAYDTTRNNEFWTASTNEFRPNSAIELPEISYTPGLVADSTRIWTINGKKLIAGWEDGTTNVIAPVLLRVNGSIVGDPNFIDSIYIQFATSGNNIYALPLNSGVTAGTYSNPSLTVDVKGRITNISSGSSGDEVTVNGSATSNPNFKDGSNITFGLSGSDVTADLTATGVAAASYTYAGGSVTVDAKGRVTGASSGLSPYQIVRGYITNGANVTITDTGTNISISATTGGSTNGTPLYVDAAGPLATANLADSTEVNPAASGTNVTFSIVPSSITTNKIDTTFYNLLMASTTDTATNILVNGTLVSLANLQDDTGAGGINFVVSGSNIKAYATNVAHGLTFTNGLTNSANVVQWAVSPGANITLTTNNGQITIAASTGVTNSGTGVSVDSGALLVYANLVNSSELDPSVSGTNVSFAIVNNSLETNRLTTNAFIYLLNRANHLNTQPWSTIDSTPTTLGGYGIVNAQLTNTTLTRLGGIGPGAAGDIIYRDEIGWTNLAKGTDGDVLTLASGYPNWEPPSVGSSGGYLAKSVTVTMASNTVDEVDLVTWTIPADTLSTDGDELEFHVPAKYRQYTGLTTAYTYEFAIDDDTGGEAYIDGSFAPGTASISSAYQMDWTVRVKRMSSTTAFITLKHVLGADNAGDTTNIVTASRYLEHTLNVGWNDDVVFQLRVSLGTAAADHCIVAYGSTVRKLR